MKTFKEYLNEGRIVNGIVTALIGIILMSAINFGFPKINEHRIMNAIKNSPQFEIVSNLSLADQQEFKNCFKKVINQKGHKWKIKDLNQHPNAIGSLIAAALMEMEKNDFIKVADNSRIQLEANREVYNENLNKIKKELKKIGLSDEQINQIIISVENEAKK